MLPSNHKQAERVLARIVNDGAWRIDDSGRVYKKTKSGYARCKKRLTTGYLMVRKMICGKRICGLAYRLVWQILNGDIPDGMVVNHKNGIKDDNRPCNLEVTSASENLSHAHRSGLHDEHGEKNPHAKLTDGEVAQIRLAFSQGGYTQAALAARFGVSHQHVSKLVRGSRRPKQGSPRHRDNPRNLGIERDLATGRYRAKARAGHLLDGREHREMPEVRHG